ncbi:unnamed protein product, partial [Vitis vinifera]
MLKFYCELKGYRPSTLTSTALVLLPSSVLLLVLSVSAVSSRPPPAPHAPLLFTGNSTTLTSPAGTLPPPPRPTTRDEDDDDQDFAFDFSGQLERTSLSADELFDGGKIRPLRPPPRLQLSYNNPDENFKSAISERKTGSSPSSSATSTAATSRKVTRSLSPLRVSDVTFGSEHSVPQNINNSKLSSSSSKSSRIWRLRDFLLFRSASEGRAASKDPLRKYSLLTKKNEDVKNCSFRSTDSSGSVFAHFDSWVGKIIS